MLDHHHRGPCLQKTLKHSDQGADVQRVQADGGLVEHKQGVVLGASHLEGNLEPLGLPAREGRGAFAQGQVTQPQLTEQVQLFLHLFHPAEQLPGLVHRAGHQLGQADGAAVPGGVTDGIGLSGVAQPPAVGAGDRHIGEELDVHGDLPGAVAAGTAQGTGVVGEIPGLASDGFGLGQGRKQPPQIVQHPAVSGHRGADVGPDGGRVDHVDPADALGLQGFDMARQGLSGDPGLQSGHQALQYQGGLARAGYPGHHRQAAFGQPEAQGMDGMQGTGLQGDGAFGKQRLALDALPGPDHLAPRQERSDQTVGVLGGVLHRAGGYHTAPVLPGAPAHLHQPVGGPQHLGVMLHQNDGVAVACQVPDDPQQALHIGGMQPDGRLVQHIQHAGALAAHRPGQLYPLPLSGGKGAAGPVQSQIAQAQVQQAAGGVLELGCDAGGHLLHGRGHLPGHGGHPAGQCVQRHGRGLGQRNAPQQGGTGPGAQPGPAAVGAGGLFEELFHPLHPLVVLYLGQGVFHRIHRVVVGEVQLGGLVGALGLVEDVLFDGGAVVDDLLFPACQVPERHVGAHPHLPADVHHQGPHQAVPGGHGALVDG